MTIFGFGFLIPIDIATKLDMSVAYCHPMQDQFTAAPQLSYSDMASGGEGSSFLDVITTEEAAALVSEGDGVCVYVHVVS